MGFLLMFTVLSAHDKTVALIHFICIFQSQSCKPEDPNTERHYSIQIQPKPFFFFKTPQLYVGAVESVFIFVKAEK